MPRDESVTSRIMASVRSKDTKAEVALRKELWARGLRYRKYYKDLPGKPDITIISSRIAVFIDGDFWHGNYRNRGFNSLEEQFRGINNSEWWIRKIRRNIERDRQVDSELKRMGFEVIRFWESEVIRDVNKCADKVIKRHIERLERKAREEDRI